MIAGMEPELLAGHYLFCTSDDPQLAAQAIATFREPEGLSLILPEAVAAAAGLAGAPMRHIRLNVASSLEGVGLTAAVAGRLAEHGIACNVVAATHHDHLFVPASDAERALGLLQALAAGAAD